MAFRVTVEEIKGPLSESTHYTRVALYEQTVEALDLQAVIQAVNTPPPLPKRSHRRKGAEGTLNQGVGVGVMP